MRSHNRWPIQLFLQCRLCNRCLQDLMAHNKCRTFNKCRHRLMRTLTLMRICTRTRARVRRLRTRNHLRQTTTPDSSFLINTICFGYQSHLSIQTSVSRRLTTTTCRTCAIPSNLDHRKLRQNAATGFRMITTANHGKVDLRTKTSLTSITITLRSPPPHPAPSR